MCRPVIIVHGLMVSDTPFWCGKSLNQKTALRTNSMTIRAGSLLNGSIVHALRHLYLTVGIYRSISPTCSSSATSFNRIPRFAMSPCRFLNCPTISIQSTLNPPCAYVFLMFLIAHNRSSAFCACQWLHCPKSYTLGYSYHKWYGTNKHDVTTYRHLLVLLEYSPWYCF